MMRPNESPAFAAYTLLFTTTQTKAQEPARPILPKPMCCANCTELVALAGHLEEVLLHNLKSIVEGFFYQFFLILDEGQVSLDAAVQLLQQSLRAQVRNLPTPMPIVHGRCVALDAGQLLLSVPILAGLVRDLYANVHSFLQHILLLFAPPQAMSIM